MPSKISNIPPQFPPPMSAVCQCDTFLHSVGAQRYKNIVMKGIRFKLGIHKLHGNDIGLSILALSIMIIIPHNFSPGDKREDPETHSTRNMYDILMVLSMINIIPRNPPTKAVHHCDTFPHLVGASRCKNIVEEGSSNWGYVNRSGIHMVHWYWCHLQETLSPQCSTKSAVCHCDTIPK